MDDIVEKKSSLEIKQDTLNKLINEQLLDKLQPLINEDDPDKIKEQLELFNVSMIKKNAIRVAGLTDTLDKLNSLLKTRIEESPNDIADKDLASFIDKTQKSISAIESSINKLNEQPLIQLKQDNTNITINTNGVSLDKKNQDNILEVIEMILKESEKEIIDIEDLEEEETDE